MEYHDCDSSMHDTTASNNVLKFDWRCQHSANRSNSFEHCRSCQATT